MFKLACKIPKKVEVALSGGPDSVALLGFCVDQVEMLAQLSFITGQKLLMSRFML
jgi:7-cyano-7-deazaguanine synthase in queuosine biosynthesis